MTLVRLRPIRLQDIPCYHLVSRYVQLTFLGGKGARFGQSERNDQWWVDKLNHQLPTAFLPVRDKQP